MAISRQILFSMVVCVVINLSHQQTEEDGFFYYQRAEYPKDCQDVYSQCTDPSQQQSGVYVIKPQGYNESFEVYCDQETDGGGWTVFQRRKDDTIDFDRPLDYYTTGFGFLNEEHWLGNDKLAYLTNQQKYQLRIDLKRNGQSQTFALYGNFRITDDMGSHKIVDLEEFSTTSTASNRMTNQNDQPFSESSTNGCDGGWWFTSNCNEPNLNGLYSSFHWDPNAPLEFSEMKIRPAP